MPKYTGIQSVLNEALGEYHQQGFRLIEPDDHTLVLYYHDEKVAIFSLQGALIPTIRTTCQMYLIDLEGKHGQAGL